MIIRKTICHEAIVNCDFDLSVQDLRIILDEAKSSQKENDDVIRTNLNNLVTFLMAIRDEDIERQSPELRKVIAMRLEQQLKRWV